MSAAAPRKNPKGDADIRPNRIGMSSATRPSLADSRRTIGSGRPGDGSNSAWLARGTERRSPLPQPRPDPSEPARPVPSGAATGRAERTAPAPSAPNQEPFGHARDRDSSALPGFPVVLQGYPPEMAGTLCVSVQGTGWWRIRARKRLLKWQEGCRPVAHRRQRGVRAKDTPEPQGAEAIWVYRKWG